MRILLTILCLYCLRANSTIYYVSNAGSDAANGTSTSTSWQTIAKVNASVFSAGDQILFKAGDVWNEKLTPSNSGTVGAVITYGSYGTGVKPVFTGLQTLGGLTNVGNVWSATASASVKNLNTVIVNGVIRAKARYPNTTTFLTNNPSTTTTINTALTGTPSYVGAELVLNDVPWILDVVKVFAQSGGTLTVSPVTYTSDGNNAFFFQNLPSFLDVEGEWVYDSTTKLLSVYSTSLPVVQYSTLDTLVYFKKKDYLTFDNLQIIGANRIGIGHDTSTQPIIQNCTFNFSGRDAIFQSGSTYPIIKKDSISNSLSDAIYSYYRCDYYTIDSNYIKNTGILAGMAGNDNLTSMGMHAYGTSGTVTNNRIDSVGYTGIYFSGDSALIKYNYITNFCYNKSDGAGIYCASANQAVSIVRKNLVFYGISPAGSAPCLYFDYDSHYITCDSNTFYSGTQRCVQFHYPNHITFRENTMINGVGAVFWYSVGGPGDHFEIKKNIFYSTDSNQYVMYNYYNTFFAGSVVDSNYYLRPLKENLKFRVGFSNTSYSLADWITYTGYDTHSVSTPTGVTSAVPLLYFNPTIADSTIALTGLYIDAKGVQHNNSITLKGFTSSLLFKSIQEAASNSRIYGKTFKLIQL